MILFFLLVKPAKSLLLRINMGLLSGSIIYLSGAIDNAKDDGVGWRRSMIESAKDLGIKWIDPTNKPAKFKPEIGTEKHLINRLKEEGDFEEIVRQVKRYRREDLRFVDISDSLIAYIDPDIHLAGTYDEIYLAERQCKPRFLIIKGGKKRCPNWLFGVFKVSDMFDSVDECIQRLRETDNGNYPVSREWVLIRDLI